MPATAKIAVQVGEPFSQIETRRIRAAVVDFDMPTSEPWCGIMKRARLAKGLTQADLGTVVDTTQTTISEIENEKVGGSKYVPAICLALGIPLPVVFITDEFDQRWVDVGRALRATSMRRFMNYLENFEEEAGIRPAGKDQPDRVQSIDGELERRSAGGAGPDKTS